MIYDILIIFFLIIANGFFAMSEMAIVASRHSRLEEKGNNGSNAAKIALRLAKEPEHFLSTVQVGITLIGVISGAFGGAALSGDLAIILSKIAVIEPYAETIAFVIVVSIITYLSLIIGELVPKRIALANAERIALLTAPVILVFTKITLPIVKLLSFSTALVLKIFPQKKSSEPSVTEEEVSSLLRQAQASGVLEESEVEMVDHIFELGDTPITFAMTPRSEMIWYNMKDADEENWKKIIDSDHSTFPVCNGSLDKIMGMVAVKDCWFDFVSGKEVDIKSIMSKPLYVPDTASVLQVVKILQEEHKHSALVVGEFGTINGMVTLMDVLEGIIGDMKTEFEEEPSIIETNTEGIYFVDGAISIEEFKEYFSIEEMLPNEESNEFSTLAGFIIDQFGHIPQSGEVCEWKEWSFEVVDMDYSRVDKVRVTKK